MTPSPEPGQGTTAVRQGHEINIAVLGSYLENHLAGFKAPLEVRQFSLGQSNPTFLIKDARGVRYVVRKKPPGQLLSSTAHAVEREFRVLDALDKRSNVPVPKIFHLCEDTSVIGTPFYVMDFVEGRIFSDTQLPSLSPQERRQCWYSVIETLAKLHLVNYRDIGLGDFGKANGFYSRQIRSLRRVSEAQAAVKDPEGPDGIVGPIPRLDEMLAWFERNAVEDATTVVHGDFKLDNMIFHPTEPRVIAILDWELSTIGHPLSDLANLLQPYYISPDSWPFPGAMKDTRVADGIPSSKELIQHYCKLVQRPYPLQNWMFCVAFSFFRLAVITQGIAARLAKGQASSAEAKTYAALFRPIAYKALEIVDAGELNSPINKL